MTDIKRLYDMALGGDVAAAEELIRASNRDNASSLSCLEALKLRDLAQDLNKRWKDVFTQFFYIQQKASISESDLHGISETNKEELEALLRAGYNQPQYRHQCWEIIWTLVSKYQASWSLLGGYQNYNENTMSHRLPNQPGVSFRNGGQHPVFYFQRPIPHITTANTTRALPAYWPETAPRILLENMLTACAKHPEYEFLKNDLYEAVNFSKAIREETTRSHHKRLKSFRKKCDGFKYTHLGTQAIVAAMSAITTKEPAAGLDSIFWQEFSFFKPDLRRTWQLQLLEIMTGRVL